MLATLAILPLASCSDERTLTQPPDGNRYTSPTGLVTANPPQVLVGAGDISTCGNNSDEATAQLLDVIPGTVFTAGDNVMPNGTTSEFANCYDPTWGRHKGRTKPAAGNHDYNTSGAAGYFAYFGTAAGEPGRGYYSYSLGAWHIVVLNSNISTSAGSAQDTWLKADLAAHPNQCTFAYYHHPLYSSASGSGTGGATLSGVRPLVNALYAAHADLIMNGHRHIYERIAPMKPDGTADPALGLREFIVGTGGDGGGSPTNVFPLSEVRNGDTRGVLKLYLYDDSYAWKFVPIAGKTFTDSGSAACHFSGGGGSGGVSATTSTVQAAPASFTASSGSATITVTAKDGNGTPVSGASVTIAATGNGNTLTPASGTSDGNGVFTSTFTSSVAEVKSILATVNGTAITQTASVTVNSSGGGGGGGGNGTITQTLLTAAGNGANQSVYTTASIAPAANALVTVAVRMRRSTGPLTPTLSGGGMASWTQVATLDYGTIATPDSRISVFRGMSASPGSGPITITFSGSISNAEWSVSQWTGVDQSGTNGSGALGQIGSMAGDATTSLSKGLAPFARANNIALGVVGAKVAPPAVTPGSGFTEIAEPTSGETTLLESERGVNLNTVSATLSRAVAAGLLAIELVAGSNEPAVSASQSTVAASPTSITAGGSGSTITIVAKDGSGNPMSGITVTLSGTGSGNTITQPATSTNSSGVATGSFSSTGAGTHTVTAVAGDITLAQQPVVTVNPGPADAARSTVTTSPTAIVQGSGSSTITVTVRDAYGNPVSGTSVGLHATGSGNTLTGGGTTNGSGVVTGSLSSTVAETKVVSATAGVVD
ncbi:MAG TPA: Ig-like domain-containing protein, partial [Gemmatimonadales bacterium]